MGCYHHIKVYKLVNKYIIYFRLISYFKIVKYFVIRVHGRLKVIWSTWGCMVTPNQTRSQFFGKILWKGASRNVAKNSKKFTVHTKKFWKSGYAPLCTEPYGRNTTRLIKNECINIFFIFESQSWHRVLTHTVFLYFETTF